MEIKQIIYGLCVLTLFFVSACKKKEFEVSKTGTQYKFFVKNENAKKVKGGLYIDFHLMRKDHNDSLVGDRSFVQLFPDDSIQGDPMLEAFRMMSEGDSALFKLSTDTLLAQRKKAVQTRIDAMRKEMNMQMSRTPSDSIKQAIQRQYEGQIQMIESQTNAPDPNLPPGKYITLIIKINGVKTEEEIRKAEDEKIEKQKKIDDKALVDYLKKNKLEAKSTASGLYYIIEKEGTGPLPKTGDQVSVQYVGKLLDGKVFDTSLEEVAKKNNVYNPQRTYEPLKFPLGVQPMIKGWEEAMYLIKEGSTAKIFLPSYLAYGPAGSPPAIAPNANIMFEIELVKIEPGTSSN